MTSDSTGAVMQSVKCEFSSWTVKKQKSELALCNARISGKKEVLIQRLVMDLCYFSYRCDGYSTLGEKW